MPGSFKSGEKIPIIEFETPRSLENGTFLTYRPRVSVRSLEFFYLPFRHNLIYQEIQME